MWANVYVAAFDRDDDVFCPERGHSCPLVHIREDHYAVDAFVSAFLAFLLSFFGA